MNTEEENIQTVRVILPVSSIPLGATVTKKTGTKPYTIKDRIRIFSPNPEDRKEIVSTDGSRFLLSQDPDQAGDANVCAGDSEVVWVVNIYTLRRWLEDMIEGPRQ